MPKSGHQYAQGEPRPLGYFEPEEVIDAIERANGIVTGAARILDCHRRTIFNYIKSYEEVEKAYNEARERVVDIAELQQIKALKDGQRWAIENWLFCSKEGRARGWLKRAEQAQDLNLLNAIQIVIPDNTRDNGAAEVTVDYAQLRGDGYQERSQFTYPTTVEELQHQKQIANLRGGKEQGENAQWLLEIPEEGDIDG